MNSRLVHYRFALFFSVFILITTVTGLLWAYAPYLYWNSGYKEKKVPSAALNMPLELLGFEQLIARFKNLSSESARAVELRNEAGLLVYEVKTAKGSWLFDAVTGSALSPLSQENARLIGLQYLSQGTEFRSAELVPNWIDRKDLKFDSVWVLKANDPGDTEIVIDANSGAILEDSDQIRRFHFWIMKLHQFKFLGTHKELTALSGIPLLALLITGSVLSWKRLKGRSRGKQKGR